MGLIQREGCRNLIILQGFCKKYALTKLECKQLTGNKIFMNLKNGKFPEWIIFSFGVRKN